MGKQETLLTMQQDFKLRSLSALLIWFPLTGCVAIPPDLFVVTSELQQKRQIETRPYDDITEMKLTAASTNFLQYLGYNLENSETKLGVIVQLVAR